MSIKTIKDSANSRSQKSSKIEGLVDSKIALLSKLLELGKQQQQCVETGDVDGLLLILSQKQPLVNQMIELQRLFDQVDASELQTAGIRKAAAHCDALGKEVLAIEKVCENAATSRKEKLAGQIDNFSKFDSRSDDFVASDCETHIAQFDQSS